MGLGETLRPERERERDPASRFRQIKEEWKHWRLNCACEGTRCTSEPA